MKPYEIHENWIKALIVKWYADNNKQYDVLLTNEFKK